MLERIKKDIKERAPRNRHSRLYKALIEALMRKYSGKNRWASFSNADVLLIPEEMTLRRAAKEIEVIDIIVRPGAGRKTAVEWILIRKEFGFNDRLESSFIKKKTQR